MKFCSTVFIRLKGKGLLLESTHLIHV